MGKDDVSNGGKCFQDRESGISLLCLKNSEEANAVGTHWVRGKVGDEWPLDFTLSKKGCHRRVLRSTVIGSALPLGGGAVWLLVECRNKESILGDVE